VLWLAKKSKPHDLERHGRKNNPAQTPSPYGRLISGRESLFFQQGNDTITVFAPSVREALKSKTSFFLHLQSSMVLPGNLHRSTCWLPKHTITIKQATS
jgi:hypothetical protein